MSFSVRPISLKEANAFVFSFHRHNSPVVGHKFSISCYFSDRLCGVAIVGRPVNRYLDDGLTLEVLRLCTDGTYNACSFLYSRCARIVKELGYKKIITYILSSENGSSLRASGWSIDDPSCGGGSWLDCSRRADDFVYVQGSVFIPEYKYPACKKVRYVKFLEV